MALILSIETGTDVCSVALARQGEVISLRESNQGRDHASKVALFVDEILSLNNMEASDLDAVAVSMGPGSYTGLRIGVSFAKGLCYGIGKPLIAVGSLDALTQVALEERELGIIKSDSWAGATLAPMIDARRMEVYTARFDSCGVATGDVEAMVVDGDSFADLRNEQKPLFIFGNGAAKCAEVLDWATLIEVVPSARGMARLAEKFYTEGKFVDLAYFEPLYLKDFVVTASKKKLF